MSMTTFQLTKKKKTSLEQKQSNISADILTHHIQASTVTHNVATKEDLQQGSVTRDNPASPWTTAISYILILYTVATILSTRIYLRLQEIHTTVVKICSLPSVTRVTSLQSRGVIKD